MVPSFVYALAALPLAFAQYNYPAASSSASATHTIAAPSAIQTVSVGQNGLTFTPDTIHAKIGEQITFQFFPKNHSVVQADFNNPCNPSAGGIFSGFVPTTARPSNQTFTITVQETTPIWLYCAALLPSPHCAAGMVAVINPPASGPNNLDAFKALARRTNTSTVPSTGVSGGVVSVGGGSLTPSTSAPPAMFTGAASSLAVGGGVVVGVMGMLSLML